MDWERFRSSASLDLTHVQYDDTSYLSLFLALVTLSPILLMASYAALAVQTREYIIIVMWAGQFIGEGVNWVIKRLVKEQRPIDEIGNGYGFPSSHSQYMGYFSAFLMCHLFFSHRFGTTGYWILDKLWRTCVYAALGLWTGIVAYSRYSLGYHTPYQIMWGLGIGVILGIAVYACGQEWPRRYPGSVFGQIKLFLLDNPVSTWCQLRDGWEIWPDGGRETEWHRWRSEWDGKRIKLKAGKAD